MNTTVNGLRHSKEVNMSDIEHEAKIINISPATIRRRLKKIGATKVGDYHFRRYVFDTIPASPDRWVRLRSDGKSTTLTVKEINSSTIDGTNEWEVTVSDLATTLKILEKIGIKPRGYQENKREEYQLDGVQIAIDSWPKLEPYVEIEATNSAEVIATATRLGYSEQALVAENTTELYRRIGMDIKKITELKFED